jgi:methionine aminotransferase
MPGVAALREQIARKVADLYGCRADMDAEVTVTAGATEAIFCAITAVVRPGDEVIVFDPAYDCYEPAITLSGGVTASRTLSQSGRNVGAVSGTRRVVSARLG